MDETEIEILEMAVDIIDTIDNKTFAALIDETSAQPVHTSEKLDNLIECLKIVAKNKVAL